MNPTIRQVSSLIKIRSAADLNCPDICRKTVLAGERINYQICMSSKDLLNVTVSVDSPLAGQVRLYSVRNVYMDAPTTYDGLEEEDYLSFEPGFMPDVLIPLADQKNRAYIDSGINTFWVRLDVPKDTAAGTYPVTLHFSFGNYYSLDPLHEADMTMQVEVLPVQLPDQKLIYTRWFHTDCIADYHKTEVYSEAHWEWIEKYIATAADTGINMLLVPVHTPPLDTAIGTRRTCVQLVDIEKNGDEYTFDFTKFRRYIGLCRKYGIRYFEIAHMFSQWGATCAPNIMVTENGVKDYLFGWHVSASSDLYINFLKQYITAISEELEAEGISEQTYFHISDEPDMGTIDTYRIASELICPLLKGSKTFDALSQIDFYEKGLVECPVTAADHMVPFLEKDIPNQWTYYCVAQQKKVTNSFLANPSYRTRIAGFLMYRYDIKGFLHWGYNFYNSPVSMYPINPYLTTSADGCYPSGDAFNVYPGQDKVYTSLRAEIFHEALQDMRLCCALEERIGRDAVVKMIDDAAGYTLTFDRYPKGNAYLENLRDAMVEKLKVAKQDK